MVCKVSEALWQCAAWSERPSSPAFAPFKIKRTQQMRGSSASKTRSTNGPAVVAPPTSATWRPPQPSRRIWRRTRPRFFTAPLLKQRTKLPTVAKLVTAALRTSALDCTNSAIRPYPQTGPTGLHAPQSILIYKYGSVDAIILALIGIVLWFATVAAQRAQLLGVARMATELDDETSSSHCTSLTEGEPGCILPASDHERGADRSFCAIKEHFPSDADWPEDLPSCD